MLPAEPQGWVRAAWAHRAASLQEMPQDLRSPERTPPSEEDSAEAERLKTEGEGRWPVVGGDLEGSGQQTGPWGETGLVMQCRCGETGLWASQRVRGAAEPRGRQAPAPPRVQHRLQVTGRRVPWMPPGSRSRESGDAAVTLTAARGATAQVSIKGHTAQSTTTESPRPGRTEVTQLQHGWT